MDWIDLAQDRAELRRWYINITITILNTINRPVFYLKHDVSETGVCLCLQAELAQIGPIERAKNWYPETD
jgi:hypothetical protein